MKRFFAAALLAMASVAVAQTTTQATGSGATTPAATPAQEKTIKDPAEYQAYKNAVSQADPSAKGASLEAFVQQYPNTVVKEDALIEAMVAYQQAGNIAKMQAVANEILQVNPNNLRALTVLAFTKLQPGEQALGSNQIPQAVGPLGEAAQYAQKGLQVIQAGAHDPDTQKLAATAKSIFLEALGMNAYANKNYGDAQKYLRAEAEAQGNNTSLTALYFLALSYLQANPMDCVNGCWFGARTVNVASPAQQQSLNQLFLYYYKKYHGSDQGWTDILAQAKTTAMPPAGFDVAKAPPPPTPAQQAQKVLETNQPKDLSLEDWLFILGSGYQQGADQVWDFLKGKKMEIQGTVLTSTKDSVVLMITDDAKQEKTGQITITMKTPFRTPPAPNTVVDYDAVFASYTTNPAMISMDDGTQHGAPATHKTPVHRRTH